MRTCHCLCLCMCVLKVTVSRCSFGFSLPVQRISNMAAKICVAFNCTTRRTLTSAQAPCPALCMHAHAWNEQRVVNTLAQILFRIMSRQMPPCTRCEMKHSICKIYILLLFLFCLYVRATRRSAQMQRQTKATTKCKGSSRLRSLKDTVTVTKLQCALPQLC